MKREYKNTGFTIVELLIVIIVVGILAAISIVAYNELQERARSAKIMAETRQFIKQLDLYKTTHGNYPDSDTNPRPYAGRYSAIRKNWPYGKEKAPNAEDFEHRTGITLPDDVLYFSRKIDKDQITYVQPLVKAKYAPEEYRMKPIVSDELYGEGRGTGAYWLEKPLKISTSSQSVVRDKECTDPSRFHLTRSRTGVGNTYSVPLAKSYHARRAGPWIIDHYTFYNPILYSCNGRQYYAVYLGLHYPDPGKKGRLEDTTPLFLLSKTNNNDQWYSL